MKNYKCVYLLVFFTTLVFSSCLKDGTETFVLPASEKGHEINEIVPPDILVVIENLGMPVYTGGNPPFVEGTFLVSPYVLDTSNIANDFEVGHEFSDLYLTFSKQNNDDLSITLDYVQGGSTGSGLGGFIIGNNGFFSVFSEMIVVDDGHSFEMARLISGELTNAGIRNYYNAIFMIDDHGDPNGTLIENGKGRLLYDKDGMSGYSDKYKFMTYGNSANSDFHQNIE